jgi:prepilin-type processing-associated H-X9-DG protein
MGVALQAFLSERQAYPTMIAPTNSEDGRWWAVQLERTGFGLPITDPNFYQKGVWRCPSAPFPPPYGPDDQPFYGYNAFGVLPVGDWNGLGLYGHFEGDRISPIRESEIVNPSDMIAMGDKLFGGFMFMRDDLASNAKWKAPLRHEGKANVLFCDGHVESLKLEALFEDKSDAALDRWNRDHQPHRERLQ